MIRCYTNFQTWGCSIRPNEPLTIPPRLTLDQESFLADQDLLLREWFRNIRHPDVDPGGV